MVAHRTAHTTRRPRESGVDAFGGTVTINQLAAIAARHLTRMVDAMIAACVAKALETGEPLDVPERHARPAYAAPAPTEDVDWERLMVENKAPRGRHGV